MRGRRVIPGSLALLGALTAMTAGSSGAAAATAPMPSSGLGSITRVLLGQPNDFTAQCATRMGDGSVWVLGTGQHQVILRVDPDGVVDRFRVKSVSPYAGSSQCIAAGNDGGLWFGASVSEIGRFDLSTHSVTLHPTPTANSLPSAFATAPSGEVWFAENRAHRIGRIDRAGLITEYSMPERTDSGPTSITVLPDGGVWATAGGQAVNNPAQGTTFRNSIYEFDPHGNSVHRLFASTAYAAVPAISQSLTAVFIGAGPDGHPVFGWGAYPVGVGRVNAGAVVQQVKWPAGDVPTGMALGADNLLWFAVHGANGPNYGFIDHGTPTVTIFQAPRDVAPFGFTAGPGNDVSFTAGDNYLYRVSTGVPFGAEPAIPLALRAPNEISLAPSDLGRSALLASGFITMVAFPAQLFNSTLQTHYAEVMGWFGFLRGSRRKPKPVKDAAGEHGAPVFAIALVLALSAFLAGFVDPHFGPNLVGLETVLANLTAIVFTSLTVTAVGALALRALHRIPGHFRIYRGGIVLALGCVALSRLTGAEPGYIYGVMLAYVAAKAAELPRPRQGRLAAISYAVLLVLSLLIWLLWIPVKPAAAAALRDAPTAPTTVFLLTVGAAMATFFVAGVSSMLFSLLPMRFLDGEKLVSWHRLPWLVLFSLGMFLYVHVVLASSANAPHQGRTYATAIGLFLFFGVSSTVFWAYFRFRPERARVTIRPAGTG